MTEAGVFMLRNLGDRDVGIRFPAVGCRRTRAQSLAAARTLGGGSGAFPLRLWGTGS